MTKSCFDDQRRYRTQQALVELVLAGSAGDSGTRGPSAVDTFFTLVNSDSIPLTGAGFTDVLNANVFVAGSVAVTVLVSSAARNQSVAIT